MWAFKLAPSTNVTAALTRPPSVEKAYQCAFIAFATPNDSAAHLSSSCHMDYDSQERFARSRYVMAIGQAITNQPAPCATHWNSRTKGPPTTNAHSSLSHDL